MTECHIGFSSKLEIFKYSIQAVYFSFGLFFHVRILRTFYIKFSQYSRLPFYRLYHIDSWLSILIISVNLFLIRPIAFLPALCPLALQVFSFPSQLISLLFIDQYLKFVKLLVFCFMMINRVSGVICPISHSAIHSCLTTHVILFSFLGPLLGVWPVFLSDSQFVPFQGGFIHETRMNFQWISISSFSVIISIITICVAVICGFLCLCCMSRTRSENKHIEQSLTASALCMSIFYAFFSSMDIYLNRSKADSRMTDEFWRALLMFSFDVLLIFPPVIMLCLNFRLRVDVFYRQKNTSPTSEK